MLQSLTPRYSMCGCDSPQSPDCNSLIPSLEENYNLTLFEEAYFEALNDSNSFAACLSAFTDTFTPFCNADWNYRYHWLIENCVPSSCPSCQFDPQNCKQFVGAVSQDYPPAAGFTPLSLTVWYNNQVRVSIEKKCTMESLLLAVVMHDTIIMIVCGTPFASLSNCIVMKYYIILGWKSKWVGPRLAYDSPLRQYGFHAILYDNNYYIRLYETVLV